MQVDLVTGRLKLLHVRFPGLLDSVLAGAGVYRAGVNRPGA